MNECIAEEKLKYTVPVYNFPSINEIVDKITDTIPENLLLEMILLRVRDETPWFCAKMKREQSKKEENLINIISALEDKESNEKVTKQLLIIGKKTWVRNIKGRKHKGSYDKI